jgi:multiple sugar transport system permease protein
MPTIILYGMYTIWPLLATFYYSFLEWTGFQRSGTFCGLENYQALFSDPLFFNSMKVTLQFTVLVVPLRFLLSLAVGLLLNWNAMKAKSAFRTLIFIPVVTTSAIIGTIMNMVFDPAKGPVNLFLTSLGFLDKQVFFLGNADTALLTAGMIWVWKWLGISLIYWIASLQSIPEELYEAARIDGAGPIKSFLHITAPLLVPFAAIIFILTLSDSFRVFDLMLTLTGGGPFFKTEAIELFIYRWAFGASVPDIGYASSAASIFGLLFICITAIQVLTNKVFKGGIK